MTTNETTISVRDLKAHASKLLKLLEEDSGSELIVTRHGKPCGRLMGMERDTSTTSPGGRPGLRDALSHLAETAEKDLVDATNIWGQSSDE